jgi:hypothetical protein
MLKSERGEEAIKLSRNIEMLMDFLFVRKLIG